MIASGLMCVAKGLMREGKSFTGGPFSMTYGLVEAGLTLLRQTSKLEPANPSSGGVTMLEQRSMGKVLEALTDRLRAQLGEALREIKLFGSRARGDADEKSDVDVVVIVDDRQKRRAVVIDVAADVSLEYGVAISPLVRSQSQWEHLKSIQAPITQSVGQEGITLWRTTGSRPSAS